MNPSSDNRLRNIIIVSLILLVAVGIVITIFSLFSNKNPYGEGIKIQNYNDKVKNLSKDYENNISTSLYDIVKHNSSSEINNQEIKDAYIREKSDVQNEVTENIRYQGSFIVDIDSLKQSYKVQYSYSTKENDTFVSGYPILLGCVDPGEVIYEYFKCKELIEVEKNIQEENAIVNFLPYTTLSYEIRADLTSGSLVIYADLRIPAIDLSGDTASKQQTVRLYKKQVTDWIKSQGFNPTDYTIEYNYTDNGDLIQEEIHPD